ncbi:MAG: LuxR family transcriptional regulator, partial [Anaerolineae bacterium]|nr:LuxR family transcriptional regulator [Anaerolineae bacterium]
MSTLLLKTKLYIPPARPNMVPRPRLIERLDEGVRSAHKLILVSSSAGSGKTTLLSEWAAISNLQFCWLSLDEDDNVPARFWAYIVAALQTIRPQL